MAAIPLAPEDRAILALESDTIAPTALPRCAARRRCCGTRPEAAALVAALVAAAAR